MKHEFNNGETWYVILPKNKKKYLITVVNITAFSEKTVTLEIHGNKPWTQIEIYKTSKVTFVEKLS